MAISGNEVAIYGFVKRERTEEPAGIYYEVRLVREKLALGLDTSPVVRQSDWNDVCDEAEEWMNDLEGEEEDNESVAKYVETLGIYEDQDHYKVLGLSKLRYAATQAQIRNAYRRKVLSSHPDKRNHLGPHAKSYPQAFFLAVTKAYNQLGLCEKKRRSYDSVDPEFDDSVPEERAANSKNFFEIFTPVFERNARWSISQPVPSLGTECSSREEVEKFYSFWFELQSWREFSYLDEEDKHQGEDRFERREIEKANRVEREKRRKAEMKRIRGLVQLAHKKDPRIAVFKELDRQRKEAEKEEKRRVIERKKAEEERARIEVLNEKRRLEELLNAEVMEKKAMEDKAREQQKKKMAELRKRLRATAKERNFWGLTSASGLRCMEAIDYARTSNDADFIEKVIAILNEHESCEDVVQAIDAERARMLELAKKNEQTGSSRANVEASKQEPTTWTADENALVVKAANLFPSGTIERWREIADYVNERRKEKGVKKKTEKDVIKQVKALSILNGRPASGSFTKVGLHVGAVVDGHEAEWTNEDQKAFESALKKFPASDPLRWDNIAAAVGKSKKQCIKRFKYLSELVKSKKTMNA